MIQIKQREGRNRWKQFYGSSRNAISNTHGWVNESTPYPLEWWFSKVRKSLPVFASHNLIERSPEAETIYDPERDTAFTAERWALRTCCNSSSGNEYVLTVRSVNQASHSWTRNNCSWGTYLWNTRLIDSCRIARKAHYRHVRTELWLTGRTPSAKLRPAYRLPRSQDSHYEHIYSAQSCYVHLKLPVPQFLYWDSILEPSCRGIP